MHKFLSFCKTTFLKNQNVQHLPSFSPIHSTFNPISTYFFLQFKRTIWRRIASVLKLVLDERQD